MAKVKIVAATDKSAELFAIAVAVGMALKPPRLES